MVVDFISNHWAEIINISVQLGILKFVLGLYQKYNIRAEARDDAIRSLLRSEIIHICHRAEEKQYLEVYNLENLNDMFKSYQSLGGNGAIKAMYQQALQHPIVTTKDIKNVRKN